MSYAMNVIFGQHLFNVQFKIINSNCHKFNNYYNFKKFK